MSYHLKDYDAHTYDAVIKIGGAVLDFFLINSIRVSGQEKLKEISGENSAIITANHKSRMDFLLLPVIVRKLGLEALCIAAGKDVLDVPVRDQMITMRAFPVPRTKKEITLSSVKELNCNIETILSSKQHLLFFPEGGRSYTGKTRDVQPGLIDIIVKHSLKNDHAPYFVPTLINYDRVVEDEIFLSLKGTKGSECFREDALILLKTMFLHRKINVDVKFGEPYVVCGTESKTTAKQISFHISSEWKRMSSATPISLVCYALDCCSSYSRASVSEADLDWCVEKTFEFLTASGTGVLFADCLHSNESNENPEYLRKEGLKHLMQPFRKIVEKKGRFYTVKNPDVVRYYANQFEEVYHKNV